MISSKCSVYNCVALQCYLCNKQNNVKSELYVALELNALVIVHTSEIALGILFLTIAMYLTSST